MQLNEQLKEAESLFYNLQLAKAYQLFRRHFDRIPFEVDPLHQKYVTLFARAAVELGKERELGFYVRELESRSLCQTDEASSYTLAVLSSYSEPSGSKKCRKLWSDVIRFSTTHETLAKAKLFLADAYTETQEWDHASLIIDNTLPPLDPKLNLIWKVWKGNVSRFRKQWVGAEKQYKDVLAKIPPRADWCLHLSTSLHLARVYLETDRREAAQKQIKRIESHFSSHRFRQVIADIERLLPGV